MQEDYRGNDRHGAEVIPHLAAGALLPANRRSHGTHLLRAARSKDYPISWRHARIGLGTLSQNVALASRPVEGVSPIRRYFPEESSTELVMLVETENISPSLSAVCDNCNSTGLRRRQLRAGRSRGLIFLWAITPYYLQAEGGRIGTRCPLLGAEQTFRIAPGNGP